MPQTDFKGFTLPTLNGLADHTYVQNAAGDVYPCWGRASAGKEICKGQGSQSYANCLAQPDLKAGIKYAITGVCHQTANRILFPSGLFVSRAKGYRTSVFVWSVHGRFEWKERKICLYSTPTPSEASSNASDVIERYDMDMLLLHREPRAAEDFPNGIPFEELYMMIGRFLPNLPLDYMDEVAFGGCMKTLIIST